MTFEQDLQKRQVVPVSKAQKRIFFKGFALLIFNSEPSSPTTQLLFVDLKTRTLRKTITFWKNFEFQAVSQVKQGLCVIIASRTCLLLDLDKILASKEKKIKFKKFRLPNEAQFDKTLIDCCILDDRLVVVTYSKHNRVQIFYCSLCSAIANSELLPQVTWQKVSIFKTLQKPAQPFHRLEVEANLFAHER